MVVLADLSGVMFVLDLGGIMVVLGFGVCLS